MYFAPVPEQLPNDRTNGYWALQVVVLDYTGPIFYKGKNKNLKKSLHFAYHMHAV